jgi:hypothetical protein
MYIKTTPHNNSGLTIYTHVVNTDRFYDGTDSVRGGKSPLLCTVDVDNNDASFSPYSPITYGLGCFIRDGQNGPSYGTVKVITAGVHVNNAGSSNNEPCVYFGSLTVGTTSNPQNARAWFTDFAVQGPVGIQPNLLNGISLITGNHYNGSPSAGAAAACTFQNIGPYGNSAEGFAGATCYPWDIGLHVSGQVTGGTGDGYTNAVQIGGVVGCWGSQPNYGGDQGQVARGVVVKAKNAGTSVARLGGYVSEGTGEAGGLVFGLDTNDANRASVYRPANGVLAINGKLSLSGEASSSTATPANVSGKIPIYNTSGTLIGYIPVYGSL